MNKIIIADSQAIFRAGTAKVLAMEDDFHIIAQCSELERMVHAIETFGDSIVLFASTLKPNLPELQVLLNANRCRGVVIIEASEQPSAYTEFGITGVVYRNVTGPNLVECVRRVSQGHSSLPAEAPVVEAVEEDIVGTRVRDRLTPKEMKIVALIVQGCKNRDIATRLKTTEQVIKNYLRSIYDKTGVSDRLELALFTIHHRVLAQAAAEVGSRLEIEAAAQPAATQPAAPQRPVRHTAV